MYAPLVCVRTWPMIGEQQKLRLQFLESACTEAEPLQETALDGFKGILTASIVELRRGEEARLVALQMLADNALALGKLNEAEKYNLRIIQVRETSLGPDHLETLQAVASLAYMYRLMGQLDKVWAEPLQRRVLSSQDLKVWGLRMEVTVSSVTHLAHLLKEKGRYVEAEALYRRALMTRETKYGSHMAEGVACTSVGLHHDTLQSVSDLAGLLRRTGSTWNRFCGAEPVPRGQPAQLGIGTGLIFAVAPLHSATSPVSAQALHERALSGCKNNLALVLKDRDDKTRFDSQKAEQLYREARAGATSRLGQEPRAEGLRRQSAVAQELGLDHPDTLTYEHNLAATCLVEHEVLLGNNSEEAEKLYRHVVEGREKRLGLENPDTLRSLSARADFSLGMSRVKGDMQNAKKMQQLRQERNGQSSIGYMAYKGLQLRLGEDHPHTLTCMNNLAARLAAFVFKIRQEDVDDEDDARKLEDGEIGCSLEGGEAGGSFFGDFLEALSRVSEGDAEPLCRRALRNRERHLGREHRDTLTSVNNLAFLLKSKKMCPINLTLCGDVSCPLSMFMFQMANIGACGWPVRLSREGYEALGCLSDWSPATVRPLLLAAAARGPVLSDDHHIAVVRQERGSRTPTDFGDATGLETIPGSGGIIAGLRPFLDRPHTCGTALPAASLEASSWQKYCEWSASAQK
ncbi:hypothetical protein AK812_SmicGene42541, partial [Symbiodinium microadriaticum]